MKNRLLSVFLCLLMIASSVALFAVPAIAEELNVGLTDGKLYWSGYPGADLYCVNWKCKYNGQGGGFNYRLSDSPVDLADMLKNKPRGYYEISLSAYKERSSGNELLATSGSFSYLNETEYPCLPTPELRWEGTVLKITPFDLTPYRKYGLTDNNFQASLTFYENGKSLGIWTQLAHTFEIDHLDVMMDYPDRTVRVKVTLFCNSDKVPIGNSPGVMSEEVLAQDLLNGYVTPDRISGEVTIAPENYSTSPANDIIAGCASVNAPADVLNFTWQYASAPDSSHWTDISTDRSGSFLITDSYIGKYVRVKVTADGYSGYLTSNALRINKYSQTSEPVPPELELSSGRIVVANAKKSQEYYVSTDYLTVVALESRWKDARTPNSDGRFTLNGTSDRINYVYTRFKETSEFSAGSRVAMSSIYVGDSRLDLEVDIPSYFFVGEDGENYTLAKDEYVKVSVSSPTYGGSFAGVFGYDWRVRNQNDSAYNAIYSDRACTEPIDPYSRYKTVYFKHDKTENHICIEARYNGQAVTAFLNVGNKDYIVPDSVHIEDITVPAGSDTGGFRIISDPQGVADAYYLNPLNTLSFSLKSGSGAAPTVSNGYLDQWGFEYNDGTLHVNAKNATPGVYVYDVIFTKGTSDVNMGTLKVTVTKAGAGVEGVRVTPGSAALGKEGSLQLTAALLPSGASGVVTWESSNTSVATVTDGGVVTAASSAKIGDKVTVTARCGGFSDSCEITISDDPVNPFKDVPNGKWYTNAVLWCYSHGYMTGTSGNTFEPNASFTRAMFVTVLAKIDKADTDGYTGTSFTDVPQGKWYSKPIQWAYTKGFAAGLGNGKFGPNDPVTREQLAQFLYNYTQKKGWPTSGSVSLGGFPDGNKVSNYAKNAVAWAVYNGLISGVKEGDTVYLQPKGTATRAQVALIVKNYVEKFVK